MNNMREKGFVITIDAFLGMTVLVILLALSLYFISQANLLSYNSVDLRNSANDLGAVLEKSGALRNAVLSSSSEGIVEIINATQSSYCAEVVVFDSFEVPLVGALKTGCIKNSQSVLSVKRTFVVNRDGNISGYYARIGVWVQE